MVIQNYPQHYVGSYVKPVGTTSNEPIKNTTVTTTVKDFNKSTFISQKISEGYKLEGDVLKDYSSERYKVDGKKKTKDVLVEEILVTDKGYTVKKYDIIVRDNRSPTSKLIKEERYENNILVYQEKTKRDSSGNVLERTEKDYVKGVAETKQYPKTTTTTTTQTPFQKTGTGEGLILTTKSTGVSTVYDVSSGYDKPRVIGEGVLKTTSDIKRVDVTPTGVNIVQEVKTPIREEPKTINVTPSILKQQTIDTRTPSQLILQNINLPKQDIYYEVAKVPYLQKYEILTQPSTDSKTGYGVSKEVITTLQKEDYSSRIEKPVDLDYGQRIIREQEFNKIPEGTFKEVKDFAQSAETGARISLAVGYYGYEAGKEIVTETIQNFDTLSSEVIPKTISGIPRSVELVSLNVVPTIATIQSAQASKYLGYTLGSLSTYELVSEPSPKTLGKAIIFTAPVSGDIVRSTRDLASKAFLKYREPSTVFSKESLRTGKLDKVQSTQEIIEKFEKTGYYTSETPVKTITKRDIIIEIVGDEAIKYPVSQGSISSDKQVVTKQPIIIELKKQPYEVATATPSGLKSNFINSESKVVKTEPVKGEQPLFKFFEEKRTPTKGELGLEDYPVIFTTPKGEVMGKFLRIADEPYAQKLTLDPFANLKNKPTVYEIEVSGLSYVPKELSSKPGFRQLEDFYKTKGIESGEAFIGKRVQVGTKEIPRQSFRTDIDIAEAPWKMYKVDEATGSITIIRKGQPIKKGTLILEPGTTEPEIMVSGYIGLKGSPIQQEILGGTERTTYSGKQVLIQKAVKLTPEEVKFISENKALTTIDKSNVPKNVDLEKIKDIKEVYTVPEFQELVQSKYNPNIQYVTTGESLSALFERIPKYSLTPPSSSSEPTTKKELFTSSTPQPFKEKSTTSSTPKSLKENTVLTFTSSSTPQPFKEKSTPVFTSSSIPEPVKEKSTPVFTSSSIPEPVKEKITPSIMTPYIPNKEGNNKPGFISGDKKKKRVKLFVRKAGKFELRGLFDDSGKAFKKGIEETSNTARASFKTVYEGDTKPFIGGVLPREFRTSKKDEFVVVQKAPFRISTRGEKTELQIAKRKKRLI